MTKYHSDESFPFLDAKLYLTEPTPKKVSRKCDNTILFTLFIVWILILPTYVYQKDIAVKEITYLTPIDVSKIVNSTSGQKLEVAHAFINSVYYYPTSKSLGPNAIALNMAIDKDTHNLANYTFNIIGYNKFSSFKSVATSQMEGVPLCRYTTLMATTGTISNMKKLEIESEGVAVEIPFKIARYTAPKPVIICISPQFVAEQWQLFLMHVHTANRFGAHLHIYLTSIIESYFELMKEYESQGYITLDYWLRMKFSSTDTPYFEPNGNVEWRNQAGAQTDCLLQYKEAAEYIAFFDLDDILFPKTHSTYLEEFNSEFAKSPESWSIYYGRREHEFLKADNLDSFNFHELVKSLKSSATVKRGKVVVKPERYNSTWLHYSWNEPEDKRFNITTPTLIHVQRPIQKNGGNNYTELWKMEFSELNETIRGDDVIAMDQDLWRIRNLSKVSEISPLLPNTDFYLPIVFKCYYDAFYGAAFDNRPGGFGCPNADLCELPQRANFKCIHSDALYYSGPTMHPITFHFAQQPFWSKNIGCYQ